MKEITKEYWDSLYTSNDIGWDIGFPAPVFREYIDQLEDKTVAILIPGCGNAYEAEYLLQKGFTNVTLIDIVPQVTAALEKRFESYLGKELKIICGDFFQLTGPFDIIFEQTFLSALPPNLRISYRDTMFNLLKPKGKIVGVLFNRVFDEEGPPFGATWGEYQHLFQSKFEIKKLEECYNSIDRRKGTEVFIHLVRKES